jgi:hypothetical protein
MAVTGQLSATRYVASLSASRYVALLSARGHVGLFRAVGVAGLLCAACCAPHDARAAAAALDARSGTQAYTWLVDHEPSRLDMFGVDASVVAPFDPDARIGVAGPDIRTACRQAKRDRALLLIVAPKRDAVARSAALDCGFALERDAGAVIVAPR